MTDTREDIIRQARKLEPDFDASVALIGGPGAYEGVHDKELAFAVDTISGHGFADDEDSNEAAGTYACRVDRWILDTDSQGFKTLDEFETAEGAQAAITANLPEQEPEPERTIELVFRVRTNAYRDELDDFLGHASETLFSDRGGIFDERDGRDGTEIRYEYEPTGSHWRDVSYVRMYGEMHARPFHPAAAGLPGGNELSPAEAVVQEQPSSTQGG